MDLPADTPGLAAAPETPAQRPLTVVGIGASAGGFDSIISFLGKIPADTGMAFVVVQHLYPDYPSRLVELFQQATRMHVVQIEDDQPVLANVVHVIPPKFDVRFEGGALKLVKRHRTAGIHCPVDEFFISLAREAREHAVGIILSGSGCDGSRGVAAIKEHGGITFAESRKSARFFSMPQSAIATGAVDEVLQPAAIARRLERLCRYPLSGGGGEEDSADDPEGALPRIFALLKSSTGVSFTNYKHSTLLRRITRRMVLGRIGSIEEYAALLKRSPKELEAIYNDLLINVSGFFRDPSVFHSIKRTVLPQLIKNKVPGQALRIWVAGCASGQEVYSLAMVTLEVLSQLKIDLPVQIFGTDLSEWALAKARSGFYPLSIAKEVGFVRLRKFFIRKADGYQICRQVRDLCTFARQNICEDPPFSRLDLLSCRNVLIYFGAGLQRKCIPVFYYSLNTSGVLVLGNSETIGGFADLFALADKKNKVYTKKVTPLVRPSLVLSEPRRIESRSQEILKPSNVPRERDSNSEIQRAADQLILTHFAPCGVVIDARMQVWHFRGHTSNYLEHAPGIASLNLLKMVRPELAADLSTAVHQALKTGAGVRKDCILAKEGTLTRHLSLEVIPFALAPSSERWLLIIFQPQNHVLQIATPGKGRAKEIESVYAREFERMRVELASTKESLQAIIEDHEATNEELKAANEEIESSNEELQSANEELETAKEELQSTNEELTTVNDELNSRNIEISEINDDLNNLLSSINLAIVMVDNSLTIRRTTPLSEKLFNIIPSDVGRRLRDINPNLDFPELIPMVQKVVEDLTPREREVQDESGRWYSLRVRPYRTRDNVIDGAVITLVDINDIKQALGWRVSPAATLS